jgi:hypothetical protein
MNRTLTGLLAAVLVIGVAAWLSTREENRSAPRALSLAGFATTEQLEAEKNRGMMDPREEVPSPVDEILIERSGDTIHLKRSGEGKESTWALLEPVTAKATRFQANKMVNLFKTPTQSIYSTQSSEEELGLYDLEAERRITVKLKAGGELWNDVNLIIGKVQKSESETAEQDAKHDTWVSHGDDLTTVYRIAGKDLRTAFLVPIVELRDKGLFDVTAAQLTELRVTAPGGESTLLKAIPTLAPTVGATPGAKPPTTTLWTLSEPAGYEADESVSTLARSFAGVRTREFVTGRDAPKDALDGPVWKLEGKTADGRAFDLVIADGDGQQVFARASNVTELLSVDLFTAKNLRKGLADLRHRGLFRIATSNIEALTFAPQDARPYTVKKTAAGWRDPTGKRRVDVESLLHGLVGMKVSRFARPAELEQATADLAKPEFTVRIATGDGEVVLKVGPKMQTEPTKGQRWVASQSGATESAPMLLQDHLAKRFRKELDDLAWKKLFDGSSSDIDSIEILLAGEPPLHLTRGEDNAGLALVALPEGTSPVPAAINGISNALASARVKSFFPKKRAKDVGLGAPENLRVTWKTGVETYTLEVSPQTEAQDPYARMQGGPLDGAVITLTRFQVDKLRKKVGDLAQ